MKSLAKFQQRLRFLLLGRAKPKWNRCLPVEILEEIFGYLSAERDASETRVSFIRGTLQPTLHAAALVCRVWCCVATKHLYKEIYVSSSTALSHLVEVLQRNESLRPLVHQFYFTSKVFTIGDPKCVSVMDMYNEMRIHELCPRLHCFVDEIPPRLYESAKHILYRGSSFRKTVTFLKMAVPNSMIFGGRATGCGWHSTKFEALQTLFLTCSRHDADEDGDPADFFHPTWFCMPQLRRLALQGFVITRRQKLTFPDCSPRLNTIELLRGDYSEAKDLFHPRNSPLLPYRKTLETLTITAKSIGKHSPLSSLFPRWSLGFLESLVELCIPFRSFAEAYKIVDYPPHLKTLVLVGDAENSYIEKKDRKALVNHIDLVELHLSEALKSMSQGTTLQELRRIRVLVRDIERELWYPYLAEDYPAIEMKLGLEDMQKRR